MKTKLLLMTLTLTLASCAGNGPHQPVVSAGGSGKAAAGGAPGFAQMLPVFKKNCSACHPSASMPQDWSDYATSKRYADNGQLARRVVGEKSMPKVGSPQAAAMTEDERQLIGAWVAAGAPKEAGAAPAESGKATAGQTGPVEVIPAAIQSCTSCHGTAANGPGDVSTPRLAGQNAEYLIRQLSAFARVKRVHLNGPMNKIAAEMTPDQITAAARAYAATTVMNADAAPVPADRVVQYRLGETLAVQSCSFCHSSEEFKGSPKHPGVPVLIGQNERYLRDQLNAYRAGWRKDKSMNEFASTLEDAEIDALAYYYSALRLKFKD